MVRIGDTVEAHQVNHIQLANFDEPNLTLESGTLYLLTGKRLAKSLMPLALTVNNFLTVKNMTTSSM